MPVYRNVDSAIAAVVENRVSIVKLQTGSPIGSQIIDLVDALSTNTSLKKLTLDGQGISSEGAQSLAAYLRSNKRLEHFSLYHNSIGPDGAASIADSLRVNKSVNDVDLGDNKIGDAGATSLAEALRQNRTVSYIRLHNDGIGPVGAASLAAMISKVYSLEEICLYGNKIGDEGAEAIGKALGRAAGLAELDIGDNRIGDLGVIALATGLADNSALEQLSIANNPFGLRGVAFLALQLLRGRGKIERRVKGVPWYLLLQKFCSASTDQPNVATPRPADGQDSSVETKDSLARGCLPAALNFGREADPHFQKTNRAVLQHLIGLAGTDKDVFEARLAAYLNLCARDDEIPVVAADVETQMETEEVAELPAVNTQAEQIDCDAAELVTASIDVPHAHAEVIQRAWRVRLAHGQAELRRRRLLEQQHEKEEQAARRIQTEIRRHVDRLKAVKVEEQQREKEEAKKEAEKQRMESVIGNILNFGFKRVVKRKREVSLAKLAQAVGALDGKVFAEIKSFKDPPDQIYLVMKAVLLLLGHTPKELADWRRCVVLIGQTGKLGLRRRINLFQLDDLMDGPRHNAVSQVDAVFAKCEWRDDVDAVHEINQ
eukprot:INCI13963.3.p1 GENE.INCI13963.3~~INCI13963.3.p1  ORF type:complete len:602 (-),score=105.07 INCI13963.3:672-2477(-)